MNLTYYLFPVDKLQAFILYEKKDRVDTNCYTYHLICTRKKNVENFYVNVFIVHGEDDNRAHYEHALALKDSLEANNYPFEWLVKDKEGHGFYNEDNILELNQRILSFLDKHIGS